MPSFKLVSFRLIWILCAGLALASCPPIARAQTYLFNRADFATGALPVAVAVGDFNADHLTDLAVVNAVDNTVSILLGKPDGTFAPQVTYATGRGPGFVAVGDLNRDGHLDLAITNQTDNTVSILLGKGDGTFRAHVDYATDSNPRGVWIGDLNHDGKPDVVVVDEICGSNPCNLGFISVFMGNGNGTLQTQKEYPTGPSPLNLAVADVNGDGKLDVITRAMELSNPR
jgi:FG-GAP-like repeat